MRNGWETRSLGDICQFIGGSQPPKSVFSKTEAPGYVRLIQIRDYKSDNHIVFIPRAQARRFCAADEIMIGRYGPPVFQILRGLEGAYNVALMKAVPDQSKLSPDFLFYFLQSPEIQHHVISVSERAAGQSGLNKETLEPYPILLPPLPEQQRLVGILDEAFDGIATAKANAEKNLQNSRAVYNSMSESLLADSAEDHKVIGLGDLIETLTDYHANGSYEVLRQNVELKDTEDYAWMVRSTDFENNFQNGMRYISESAYNFLTKSRIFGGEIIISKIGNAGKVYLMPEIKRPCSLAMNLFLIRVNEKRASHKYVYHYLKSETGERQIRSKLKGVATQTITKDSVRSLRIPILPKDMQDRIVSKLECVSVETRLLESIYQQKLIALDELKKSLLHQAFTGKL